MVIDAPTVADLTVGSNVVFDASLRTFGTREGGRIKAIRTDPDFTVLSLVPMNCELDQPARQVIVRSAAVAVVITFGTP